MFLNTKFSNWCWTRISWK